MFEVLLCVVRDRFYFVCCVRVFALCFVARLYLLFCVLRARFVMCVRDFACVVCARICV